MTNEQVAAFPIDVEIVTFEFGRDATCSARLHYQRSMLCTLKLCFWQYRCVIYLLIIPTHTDICRNEPFCIGRLSIIVFGKAHFSIDGCGRREGSRRERRGRAQKDANE
ncbi:hypothetical protein BDR03DRAFT_126877 [Suillus americanus]|nr:hypothetical protein BDR03DRAFT_126877 [Suillus americanus]